MSGNAYLINHPNKDDRFICNICSSSIKDNIIGLKCNSKKHVFCYECINDWYMEIKNNIKSYKSNYNFVRMCPICRKNGGYLPNLNHKHVNQIHYNGDLVKTCGYKLKGKNDYCMNSGKKCYNDLCKKHYIIDNKKNQLNEQLNNLLDNKSCVLTEKKVYKKRKNSKKIIDNNVNDNIKEVKSLLEKNNIFINIDDNSTINIIK